MVGTGRGPDRAPMCSNAGATSPWRRPPLGKGAALGTVLAFMMSVTALSLQLVVAFARVKTIGFLFNLSFA